MHLTKTQKRYATAYWLSERLGLDNLAALAKTGDRQQLLQDLAFWHENDGLATFVAKEGPQCPAGYRCPVPAWLLDGYYAA